ncbi:anhydro-N-acetylmuramic acid kinase [Limibacillus sp. MBR-115]|uniref:anhydro-N-acetylmuramic acid kinase n=1 Tax=Limibacillus sp. MBR-115 TaxID=3156465 RepID=UPI003390F8BE
MNQTQTQWAIGMMSGTSLDGIDAALIRSDGLTVVEAGPRLSIPYDKAFRQRLRRLLGRRDSSDEVDAVEMLLTMRHAEAVSSLLDRAELQASEVSVIGFHGQTLFHAPEDGVTRQIGDGHLLATLTGIPVVNELRTADVDAGGQGAPLVPVFHAALAAGLPKPLAVLNIGGVANVTWIGEPEENSRAGDNLLAFDTGPGNALIDDWVFGFNAGNYDKDGLLARRGKVDESLLATWLQHEFFKQRPPKSLDRNSFQVDGVNGHSLDEGAATLTAFTVAAVAKAAAWLPQTPLRWLICGGGRHNGFMMDALKECLGTAVDPVEAVGWDGDAIEAQAFGYLALRSLAKQPLTFPGTTGVASPTTGGQLHLPPGYQKPTSG